MVLCILHMRFNGDKTVKDTLHENREAVEIDLRKLFTAYLRKWWLILICGILLAGASLYFTMNFITPLYRATVTIYVNNSRGDTEIESVSTSNLSAAARLVDTYVNIIKSDTVLTEVSVSGNLSYSPDQIRGMLTADQVESTEIFTVSITHPDPETAAAIANTIAEIAPGKIGEIVEGSSTKIIDYAKVPTSRYSPSYKRNALLGGGVGILAAVIYLTLRCLLDVRIHNADDLNTIFDIPVLGQIPVFGVSEPKKNSYGYDADKNVTDSESGVSSS